MAAARAKGSRGRLRTAGLEEMIEEATVDAHNEEEQATGWHATLEMHLGLPFETQVLGVPVKVAQLDVDGPRVVAVCVRGKERQRIDLAELPLPEPAPDGAEWVDAYRQWARRQW